MVCVHTFVQLRGWMERSASVPSSCQVVMVRVCQAREGVEWRGGDLREGRCDQHSQHGEQCIEPHDAPALAAVGGVREWEN